MKIAPDKYLLMIFITAKIAFPQESTQSDKVKSFHPENNFNINMEEFTNNKSAYSKIEEKKKKENIESLEFRFLSTKKVTKYSFDFMSSVGSNISFGGFWDRYAIINFTPQMYIKPVSFISIYANNNLNCLIPLNGIKEHLQSITLQGLAILAVDNSMKLFFPERQWIPELISFAVKNLLINFIIKPSLEKSTNTNASILQYENYYYSMSINF